ncbi:TetR/AcrR family transcriptional regulator [Sphingomonas naphthae]|uniref:TetR/AcrR family transcriptional regulator n=1 Tax=Sphingomonas naphthae TaxID=1813468 RepID=A0ABY7THT8_9SPHN|nr:TetR/AcrR family transcriptional regulator [Sphingomonas naphthae]WCT71995.1 TetR/AcrR family transcriptional regulator [Sphingomonas naphthae]
MDREPRTKKGQATRRKLLDAAAVEFGTRGYAEASVSGIAIRAGVALGSFYTYFEGKEPLFRALVDDMSHQVRHHIHDRLSGVTDRLEAERLGIQAYIEFVRQRPEIYRIVEESQFVAEDAYRRHYDAFAQAYTHGLAHARADGRISEGSDEVRAWALIGMSVFLGLRYGLWQPEASAEEVARAAGDLVARGLSPR